MAGPVLDAFHADALRGIDVSISGAWLPGSRDWRGVTESLEPVVAVAFCRCRGLVSWSKSERANHAGQEVPLLLGSYDESGQDVRVTFSVGGGQVVSRTRVQSAAYQPAINPQIRGVTGAMLQFVGVEGSAQVELYVLFLAGSDVKVGRNGLWSVRRERVDAVPEPFRSLLTRGRTGELRSP